MCALFTSMTDQKLQVPISITLRGLTVEEAKQTIAERVGCDASDVVLFDPEGQSLSEQQLAKAPHHFLETLRFRVLGSEALPECKLSASFRATAVSFVNRLFGEINTLRDLPPQGVTVTLPSKQVRSPLSPTTR